MKKPLYNKLSAIAAFTLWFTWTYYVNSSADNVLISALSQGFISASITLMMIKLLKVLKPFFKTTSSKIFYPSLIISTMCFLMGFLIHSAINTSQVIKTIIPAVVVGFIFCIITSIKNIICEESEYV